MSNENHKINAVEQCLRYKIQIKDNENYQMKLSERMVHYNVQGVSIAVINQGQLEWAKAYGRVGSSQEIININSETLFQAASISKSINVIGALLLVQNGLLSLDEDINQYLTSWKIPANEFTQEEKVTLRRLLSHSAGINVHGFPGYTTESLIPNTIDILEGKKSFVATDPVRVIHKPGSKFQYSGGGTTISQLLIEDITGEEYAVWMERNVLKPLGMKSSTFRQPLPIEYQHKATAGYDHSGRMINGRWHVYPEKAAAGLWTTPTDLAYFLIEVLKMLKQPEAGLIKPSLMKEAITSQIQIEQWYSDTISEASGLGFFLSGSAGNFKIAHDGGNAGFISRFIALPDQGQGFVIMVNNEGAFSLIDEITHSIADIYDMTGFESIVKTEITMDITLYTCFLGTYKHEDDELTISQFNDKLFLSFPYTQEMQLHREKDDIFFVKEGSDSVKLIKSKENECTVQIINKDRKLYIRASNKT